MKRTPFWFSVIAVGFITVLVLGIFFGATLAACSSSHNGVADAGDDGGTDGGADGQPLRLGLLQFHVEHNLADDSCLARNDCFMRTEDETTTADWLAEIRKDSNLAVLHWDRAIPWLAFDADPPAGTDRVAWYDGRIDDKLRGWLDAFVVQFQAMPSGYLAVTPLNGTRDNISPFRLASGKEVDVGPSCPAIEPDLVVSFQYDDGGPHSASFDLRRAYRNLVLYLREKLAPRYIALIIETNIFKQACPVQWPGLVRFYRQIYDDIRAEVGSGTPLFVTLAYSLLLGYVLENCYGQLSFGACGVTPAVPNYPVPVPESCYPLDRQVVLDLDDGNRLDILALSFYPDGLTQAPGSGAAADRILKVYPMTWDGVSDCAMQTVLPPVLDPMAALDRLGWSKPVAMAESSARSCPTLAVIAPGGGNPVVIQPPASLASQTYWLDLLLLTARERNFEFFVQSFQRDYPVIGLWTVNQNVLTAFIYSIYNTWPCSGITDADGTVKPGVTSLWRSAL